MYFGAPCPVFTSKYGASPEQPGGGGAVEFKACFQAMLLQGSHRMGKNLCGSSEAHGCGLLWFGGLSALMSSGFVSSQPRQGTTLSFRRSTKQRGNHCTARALLLD